MTIYHFIVGSYFGVLCLLLVYCIHRYFILYLYYANRKKTGSGCLTAIEKLPRVTVQLPVYNEIYVISRLINAVTKMTYPPELLEIQVLDDSTDKTSEAALKIVEKLRTKGNNIHYYHRKERTGFKAGALQEGLKKAQGDLIAIFDADFVPEKDFLLKTVPLLSHPETAMVQTRWGHINRDYSVLSELQSIYLDAHFVLEHTARSWSGRFFNFNGTAGVWRKQAIRDAGGWQHDTLTEDLDLSYRAQLKGWKFVFAPDIVAPAEIPVSLISFKTQQHRWAKGGIETAKKLIPGIIKSPLPIKIKLEAVFHLTCNLNYLLILSLAILAYPALIIRIIMGWKELFIFDLIIFWCSTIPIGLYYTVSQREAGETWLKKICYIPLIMALGIGLSVNNGRGVLEAILGKRSGFMRTPKYRIETKNDNWKKKLYRVRVSDLMTFTELALGFYFLSAVIFAIVFEVYDAVPFLCLFVSGFFYVSFLSVYQKYISGEKYGYK